MKKTFTAAETRDLFGQIVMGEISLTRMVGILNEMVNEAEMSKYKDGDFVVNEVGDVLIFKKKEGDLIYDHAYLQKDSTLWMIPTLKTTSSIKHHATEEKKQELLNALAKKGKRWNEDKKCIEDIPTYKKGDFLVKEYKDGAQYIFILDYIDDGGLIYFHCYHADKYNSTYVADDFGIGRIGDPRHKCLRYATDLEKELLIAELSKVKKRWNAEKKCVEDIPKRKFKKGDKVRIKDGVSSKTVSGENLSFNSMMDDFIGTTMTVSRYIYESVCVVCNESDWRFHEDWLEPYTDELKEGDLAIFWDNEKKFAIIKNYVRPDGGEEDYFQHKDQNGIRWINAIKFESKEQYERLIKGEI